jgi:hypothetical protein
MPTVACVCKECGNRFYSKDTYVPVNKNNIRLNKDISSPKTWEQWVLHSMIYCEDCRLKSIPTSCLQNYEELKIKSL